MYICFPKALYRGIEIAQITETGNILSRVKPMRAWKILAVTILIHGLSGARASVNTIRLDSLVYDEESYEVSVFWRSDTTGTAGADLYVGIGYSYDEYAVVPENVIRQKQVSGGLHDSSTIQLEHPDLNKLCYVSLYLKAQGDFFSIATEQSQDTVRLLPDTARIHFFEEGIPQVGIFNDHILFRPGSEHFDSEFSAALYQPDPAQLNGFVPVGPGFVFTNNPPGTPEFDIGIRYDSIPQGYSTDALHLYRFSEDSKWRVEHDSYVEDGVVWIRTNEIRQPFMLLVDTVRPQVDFPFSSDTSLPISADGDVFKQSFSIRDNSANVRYSVRASMGDKWYEFECDSTLTDTIASVMVDIPKDNDPEQQIIGCVSESNGMRALLLVSDGTHLDTINISRRVHSEQIGQVPTRPGLHPQWVPFAVGGSLTDNTISSVLDEFVDPQTNQWRYDIYRFRLFRYVGEGVAAARADGWLEYNDSVAHHFSVKPGRLFWLKTRESKIVILGEGKTTSLKKPFEIVLAPGKWTDFASPFQFNIPFSAVMEATGAEIDSIQLYHWEKGEQDNVYRAEELYISEFQELRETASSQIISGQVGNYAYTAYNPLGDTVILRIPPVSHVEGASKRTIARSRMPTQWGVWFNWREADQANSRKVRCIVDEQVAKSRIYALAPSLETVGAGVVDTANRTLGGHSVTRDNNRQGFAWQIALYNQGSKTKTVAYNLGNLASVPSYLKACLWDPETQSFESADGDWHQETLQPSSEKTKWVVVGTEAFLSDFKTSFPANSLKLAGCYPNPFSGRLSIRYSVDQSSLKQLRFGIYDLRGRLIHQHTIKRPRYGNGLFVWNGLSSDMREVAAGQYILRMTSKAEDGIQKIIGEQAITYLPK